MIVSPFPDSIINRIITVEEKSAKKVNPFDRLRRKNQKIAVTHRESRLSTGKSGAQFNFAGISDISIPVEDANTADHVNDAVARAILDSESDVVSVVDERARQVSVDSTLSSLRGSGEQTAAGHLVRSRRDTSSSAARKKMPTNFSRMDRDAYLARAGYLISALADYYGISEQDAADQIDELSLLSNEDLAHAVNAFEYARESVVIVTSGRGSLEAILSSDLELTNFLSLSGVDQADIDEDVVMRPGFEGSNSFEKSHKRRSFS